MNKKAFMARNASEFKTMKFNSFTMTVYSFDFEGHLARLRVTTVSVVTMKQGGQTIHGKGVSEGVDTWRWTKGGWRALKIQNVSFTIGPAE